MRFRIAVAALLSLMLGLQIYSARLESQTYDEAVHLAAGYSYWKTGRYTLNPEHPPLQKLLSGLPLLFLRPELPVEHETWRNKDQYEFARVFLYRGSVPAGTLLFAGRLPSMALTFALGLAIALFTRKTFGERPAILAAALFALDPNFIAHGRYVTTDVIASLFFFLTCVLWMANRTVLSGFSAGAALLSKFSLVLVLPVLLLLQPRRWKQWLAAASLAIAAAAAVYLPEGISSWWIGMKDVLLHSSSGQPTYLLGTVRETGSWQYFPVAFAVKTPTALLLLIALALAPPFRSWLWIPAAIYFGAAMTSNLNIGVRHILPVYPFLIVLAAAAVFRLRPRLSLAIAAAAVLMQAAEIARIHPHYLAFFNSLSGGPAAGPRYLLDSNVDWGQDVKKLKAYMERENLQSICLSYFGYADIPYYGIREEYLPKTGDRDERQRADCIGAISVTLLHDLYFPAGSYRWLREQKPIGHVGHSIYLYDLRKPRPD